MIGDGGVLFLDFDGVLNTVEWCNEKRKHVPAGSYVTEFIPECVNQLNRILLHCNLEIIITSSMRAHFSDAGLANILRDNGVDRPFFRYRGNTPVLSQLIEEGGELRQSIPRRCEIIEWINVNSYQGRFLILDDFEDARIDPHFFKTDVNTGLTKEIADTAINHFKTWQP